MSQEFTPERVECWADLLAEEGYGESPAMLRAYAATLRQAARVDEGMVELAWAVLMKEEGEPRVAMSSVRAALEAALSAQPLICESCAISSESGRPAERSGAVYAVTTSMRSYFTRDEEKARQAQFDGANVHRIPDAHTAQPAERQGEFPMTEQQVRQWIDACNHEPARQVLRDYLRLRAHPTAPVGVPDGWVPIDSAPTDGTPHIRGLWVFGRDRVPLYWDACAGHIDAEDGRFLDQGGDDFGWDAGDFTHWHPLAAAPSAPLSEEAELQKIEAEYDAHIRDTSAPQGVDRG